MYSIRQQPLTSGSKVWSRCSVLLPHYLHNTQPTEQNSYGFTPLQVALLYQQWAAATVLIAAGASLYGASSSVEMYNLRNQSMDLPDIPLLLLRLADHRSTGLVAQDLSWQGPQGRTALHFAAGDGCPQRVTNLLKAGADKHARDYQGANPLWLAVEAGHVHLVPLLASPSTLNVARFAQDATPLIFAAGRGQVQMVEALLAAGAAADRDWRYRSPLAMAAQHGHRKVVAVLLEALVRKQQQQQGQGGQQQGWQHQQQPQEPSLAEMVAAAAAPLAKQLEGAPHCAQLLEVVLDVLGPEVTGEVCRELQARLQLDDVEQTSWQAPIFWRELIEGHRHNNYLAEALLLGWMGAEGRRLVPGRLQRLVPGVGGKPGRVPSKQQVCDALEQLVKGAVEEAVVKRYQQAGAAMGKCVEQYLQQPGRDRSHSSKVRFSAAASRPSALLGHARLYWPADMTTGDPAVQAKFTQGSACPLVHVGLMAAATTLAPKQGRAALVNESSWFPEVFYRAAEVHDKFLSAWVAARGPAQ